MRRIAVRNSVPGPTPARTESDAESANLHALRRENTELREALAARDEFISIVGHELRNPLSPVYLQLQVMLDCIRQHPETIDAQWLRPRLETFGRRLDRFLATLDRVLDVSRISSGRLHMEPEHVELGALVRDVVEMLRAEATAAGSEVRLDLEPAVHGRWDRLRLEQICSNLLSNAIRYGLGRPIDIELRSRPDAAELVVRDRGIGIAAADLDRIFLQFERGSGNRHRAGFGVGLWLVDKLCQAMGGRVHVHSRPGEGSTFTLVFPRQPP